MAQRNQQLIRPAGSHEVDAAEWEIPGEIPSEGALSTALGHLDVGSGSCSG